MRRTALGLVLLLCIAPLGCGADGGGRPAGLVEDPAAEDAAALVRVANKYLVAFAAEDARAACQTRSREDRRALAKLFGTCVRAYRAIVRSEAGENADALLGKARARADTVRVRDNRARVPVFAPGARQSELTLLALRENGRWLLVDVPDAKERTFLRGK